MKAMSERKARPDSIASDLLNEGLRRNDLKNLVSDVVSIDEYNSKIDESAIVLAFYVKDRSAAQDLNRFIQKSYVDLLDTDISPAPDVRGYYMVFVELPLNNKLAEAIQNILRDVGALAGINDWRMRLRTVKGTQAFNVKLVARVMAAELGSQIHEFFHASDLNDVILEGASLSLCGAGESVHLTFLSFGQKDRLFNQYHLNEAAVSMNDGGKLVAKKLQLLLGGNWDVESLGECVVLQNCKSMRIILLQML
jgi:hypothetical protein